MCSLHPNINVPWLLASSLAIWFLFIHTPTFWINRHLPIRDIMLAIHIICASTIYMACIHNCLFTPSFINIFGQPSKWMHIWAGRIGMIAGIISFTLGAYLTWSRLNLPIETGGTNLGFSIPITIGGICQVIAQYNGYIAIRLYQSLGREIEYKRRQQDTDVAVLTTAHHQSELDELKKLQKDALRKHIWNMIGVFVCACGIPASIRLADTITGGQGDDMVSIVIIVTLIIMLNFISFWYINLMTPKYPIEDTNFNNNKITYTSID